MDTLLNEITSSKLPDDDYKKILEFSDRYAIIKPKDCVRGISSKLFGNVPSSSLRAVRLLSYCSNNVGNDFNVELSSTDFTKGFKKSFAKLMLTVQMELCSLIKKLASEYANDSRFDLLCSLLTFIRENHNKIYLTYESNEAHNIARQKAHNSVIREEEESLAKAISLSLEEDKKTTQFVPEARKSSTNVNDNIVKEIVQPVNSGQGILKNKNLQVRALYDFEAAEDNELSFRQGDIITLINNTDKNWWKGKLGNSEGLFPAQFVTNTLNETRSKQASASKSIKFEDKKQELIEPDKINQCLNILNSIDTSTEESSDPPELKILEHECKQMNLIIDSEIQMVEEKMDKIQAIEDKLSDVLSLYNQVLNQCSYTKPSFSHPQDPSLIYGPAANFPDTQYMTSRQTYDLGKNLNTHMEHQMKVQNNSTPTNSWPTVASYIPMPSEHVGVVMPPVYQYPPAVGPPPIVQYPVDNPTWQQSQYQSNTLYSVSNPANPSQMPPTIYPSSTQSLIPDEYKIPPQNY